MTSRIDFLAARPELAKGLATLGQAVRSGSLEPALLDLVNIRASLLNGCAFCIDMHVKEAKIHGERELRIHHVPVWRDSPLFTPKERAALEWTEAVTRLPEGGIPDEVYRRVTGHIPEDGLAELTYGIGVINAWNRLAVSFQMSPGSADDAFGLTRAGLS